MRDAQAGVPSARRLRAQLAFKDSMVHGILQFTPSIAFRYVLHRCESRDIRCRESCNVLYDLVPRPDPADREGAGTLVFMFLGADRAGVRCCAGGGLPVPPRREGLHPPARARGRRSAPSPAYDKHVRWSLCWAGFDNDPSAGSPTETLLRLLLPLHDKVQWTSRDVAGGEPPTSPRSELHRTIQSVGATGGVYKGQGRSQRELMTRAY